MSKRARSEEPLRPIPGWLVKSGIAPEALRQLMEWMEAEDLCFFPQDELYGEHKRFAHRVEPHLIIHGHGDGEVACGKCAERCECCQEIELYIEDANLLDSPHARLCEHCRQRALSCDHVDDEGSWPDWCQGCERGCRESEESQSGDGIKYTCERCVDGDED